MPANLWQLTESHLASGRELIPCHERYLNILTPHTYLQRASDSPNCDHFCKVNVLVPSSSCIYPRKIIRTLCCTYSARAFRISTWVCVLQSVCQYWPSGNLQSAAQVLIEVVILESLYQFLLLCNCKCILCLYFIFGVNLLFCLQQTRQESTPPFCCREYSNRWRIALLADTTINWIQFANFPTQSHSSGESYEFDDRFCVVCAFCVSRAWCAALSSSVLHWLHWMLHPHYFIVCSFICRVRASVTLNIEFYNTSGLID